MNLKLLLLTQYHLCRIKENSSNSKRKQNMTIHCKDAKLKTVRYTNCEQEKIILPYIIVSSVCHVKS